MSVNTCVRARKDVRGVVTSKNEQQEDGQEKKRHGDKSCALWFLRVVWSGANDRREVAAKTDGVFNRYRISRAVRSHSARGYT